VTIDAVHATAPRGRNADARDRRVLVNSRRMLRRALSGVALAVAITGCSSSDFARNVYEGGRAYDDSLRSTPLEKSRTPAPGYDEYERERQAPSSKQKSS
jgi:hypothetical protein